MGILEVIIFNNYQKNFRGPEETCKHVPHCRITFNQQYNIPCRIDAPSAILPRAVKQFAEYFPKCCRAVQSLLGAFPFPRVDIVIYPPCCQDMALAK